MFPDINTPELPVKNPANCNAPITLQNLPLSPFLKCIGYPIGISVWRISRPITRKTGRSPWDIKMLSHRNAANAIYLERLLDEAKILRNLVHPNIIGDGTISCLEESRRFLALEYCNSSLAEVLKERYDAELGPLEYHHASKVATDMLKGLDYLHTKAKILHGDLKSFNVLVKDGFEIAKICDFGVCLKLNKDGYVDVENHPNAQYVGTGIWSAPEVLHEDTSMITSKADIFSFGLVIYEMFALVPPHTYPGIQDLRIVTAVEYASMRSKINTAQTITPQGHHESVIVLDDDDDDDDEDDDVDDDDGDCVIIIGENEELLSTEGQSSTIKEPVIMTVDVKAKKMKRKHDNEEDISPVEKKTIIESEEAEKQGSLHSVNSASSNEVKGEYVATAHVKDTNATAQKPMSPTEIKTGTESPDIIDEIKNEIERTAAETFRINESVIDVKQDNCSKVQESATAIIEETPESQSSESKAEIKNKTASQTLESAAVIDEDNRNPTVSTIETGSNLDSASPKPALLTNLKPSVESTQRTQVMCPSPMEVVTIDSSSDDDIYEVPNSAPDVLEISDEMDDESYESSNPSEGKGPHGVHGGRDFHSHDHDYSDVDEENYDDSDGNEYNSDYLDDEVFEDEVDATDNFMYEEGHEVSGERVEPGEQEEQEDGDNSELEEDSEDSDMDEPYLNYGCLGTRPLIPEDMVLEPDHRRLLDLFFVCTDSDPRKRPSAAILLYALHVSKEKESTNDATEDTVNKKSDEYIPEDGKKNGEAQM